jgi:methylated-DNA-[protein]-cysteine S-methyltransferase
MNKDNIFIKVMHYHFPCGEMILGSFDGKLCLCDWPDGRRRASTDMRLQRILKAEFVEGSSDVIETAQQQLNEYFLNQRQEFDIPLLFVGTDFQKKVWNELRNIPYGKTVSYGELARRIGMPKAVRAVANANAVNAISIIAPCHRVIGTDGSLTGYGGGLNRKKFLLELEKNF